MFIKIYNVQRNKRKHPSTKFLTSLLYILKLLRVIHGYSRFEYVSVYDEVENRYLQYYIKVEEVGHE